MVTRTSIGILSPSWLSEAADEREFWDSHWDEYLAVYEGEYVAVQGGQVVAHAADLGEIDRQLQKAQISPAAVWLKFVGPGPEIVYA